MLSAVFVDRPPLTIVVALITTIAGVLALLVSSRSAAETRLTRPGLHTRYPRVLQFRVAAMEKARDRHAPCRNSA
jgi:hypothetical protein